MIKVLFGKVGSGKSYIGEVAGRKYGYSFYDMDWDLPPDIRETISEYRSITEEMRDAILLRTINRITLLRMKHRKICVSVALFKDAHRQRLLEAFPDLELIWIHADGEMISRRLRERTNHLADHYYAHLVNPNFEEPLVRHGVFRNTDSPAVFASAMDALFGMIEQDF